LALKGRILEIRWDGRWHVVIEHVRKVFTTYGELRSWLTDISGKVRDPAKKELLLWDMRYL
jgi:hypothetical protein